MKKFSFYLFALLFVSFTSCEKKANTSESATVDTVKVDSLQQVQDTLATTVTAPALTGKAAIVAKKWKASQFETTTVKLSGDLIDVRFDFKSDSTFNYSEDGKKQTGKWSVNEKGTTLTLAYDDNRKATHNIKELSDVKMIIAGKEHGMYRTITLEPTK
jgi:hypothetical protein